jgi:hypothetical protein
MFLFHSAHHLGASALFARRWLRCLAGVAFGAETFDNRVNLIFERSKRPLAEMRQPQSRHIGLRNEFRAAFVVDIILIEQRPTGILPPSP